MGRENRKGGTLEDNNGITDGGESGADTHESFLGSRGTHCVAHGCALSLVCVPNGMSRKGSPGD